MPLSDNNKNRGAHGDSSFMLGGVPSSSENHPVLTVVSVQGLAKVLAEFSIGCLSKLVTEGEIPEPKSGWAKIKEEIRAKQLNIVKTERK